jgi:hypothetical protein
VIGESGIAERRIGLLKAQARIVAEHIAERIGGQFGE